MRIWKEKKHLTWTGRLGLNDEDPEGQVCHICLCHICFFQRLSSQVKTLIQSQNHNKTQTSKTKTISLVTTIYEIGTNKHFLPWELCHCVPQMKAVPLLSKISQNVQKQGSNKLYQVKQTFSLTKIRKTFLHCPNQSMAKIP